MASDSSNDSIGPNQPSSQRNLSGVLDRVDRQVFDRRQFLKGLGAGSLLVGGLGIGVSRIPDESSFQTLATLAGGEGSAPTASTYHLPAVDANGRGRIVTVTVETTDIETGLFVNLDGVEVRHDLQVALREAATVAQEYTSEPAEEGILVSFAPEGDGLLTLRGKSWEAGLTVVLAAAFSDAIPDRDTLVTGIVASDGTLLPVGDIESKAVAAREFGATTLLVPSEREQQVPGIEIEGVESIDRVMRTILSE